jgi:hypothetical protein
VTNVTYGPVETPPSSDFAFGTGEFTVDMWVRFNTLPATGHQFVLWIQYQDTNNGIVGLVQNINGTQWIAFYSIINGGSQRYAGAPPSPPIMTGVWYHVAWVRFNGIVTVYWNGVSVATVADSDNIPQLNTPLLFGDPFDGWLDEVRISNVARWTSNFTPPTAAYSRDNDTVLLLHFDDPDGARSTSDDVTSGYSGISPSSSLVTVTGFKSIGVYGSLMGENHTILTDRNVTIYLDNKLVGNTTTSDNGSFLFSFVVPETLSNGTHELNVRYPAFNDSYAPSNGILYFSKGGNATLSSTTSTASQTVQSSQMTTQPLFTSNTPIVIFATAILLASAIGVWSIITRRRKPKTSPQNIRITSSTEEPKDQPGTVPITEPPIIAFEEVTKIDEKPASTDKFSEKSFRALIEQEKDPRSTVKLAFRFAESMINEAIGEVRPTNETHWEFYSRVTGKYPSLKQPLTRLVNLFETAEYTSNPIQDSQRKDAVHAVNELIVSIKSLGGK